METDLTTSSWALPTMTSGGNNSGAGYVIFGRAQAPAAISLDEVATGTGGVRILGDRGGDGVSLFSDWGGDGLGFAVSGAADVNNDGCPISFWVLPIAMPLGRTGELLTSSMAGFRSDSYNQVQSTDTPP